MQRQLEVAVAELPRERALTGPDALFTLQRIVDIILSHGNNQSFRNVAHSLEIIGAVLHNQLDKFIAEATTHALVDKIEKLEEEINRLKEVAVKKAKFINNLPSLIRRLQELQDTSNNKRLICGGVADEVQLLKSESEHGCLKSSVLNLETAVSNLQMKCDDMRVQNERLVEEILACENTTKEFDRMRKRLGNAKVPKRSLILVQADLAEQERLINELQNRHKARRDVIFKQGISTAEMKAKLVKTVRECRKLQSMRDGIIRSKTPRPEWHDMGKQLAYIDLHKFINCRVGALQHPFTLSHDEESAIAPTINNVEKLCQMVEEAYHGGAKGTHLFINHRLKDLFEEVNALQMQIVRTIRKEWHVLPPHFDKTAHGISMWIRNGFMRLPSLGESPEIPLFLRAPQHLLLERHADKWSHGELRACLQDILQKKKQLDLSWTEGDIHMKKMHLSAFLYLYSRHVASKNKIFERFGGAGWSASFVWALRYWSDCGDADAHLFDLVLHDHWSIGMISKMKEVCESTLLKEFERHGCLSMSESQFRNILKAHFPNKSEVSIHHLMDSARRDTVFLRERHVHVEGSNKYDIFTTHLFAIGCREYDTPSHANSLINIVDSESKVKPREVQELSSFGIYSEDEGNYLDSICTKIWPHHGIHKVNSLSKREKLNKRETKKGATVNFISEQHRQETDNTQNKVARRKMGSEDSDDIPKGENDSSKEHPSHDKHNHHHSHLHQHHYHLRSLGFTSVLKHQYLSETKRFHSCLERNLKVYDFLRTGMILIHYAVKAINKACTQINISKLKHSITAAATSKLIYKLSLRESDIYDSKYRKHVRIEVLLRAVRRHCSYPKNGEIEFFEE